MKKHPEWGVLFTQIMTQFDPYIAKGAHLCCADLPEGEETSIGNRVPME